MNESQMLATVLKYEGALAAEQKLTEIANKEGDEAVERIAKNLSAAEVAEVTSEGDLIKPSLLHTAITPDQFRGVFRRVGVSWNDADQPDCPPERLTEFQDELQQFFCAFILLNDDEARRRELVGAILEEPHGLDALAFSVLHEKDIREFAMSGAKVEIGDWREIIVILRSGLPDKWERLKVIILSCEERREYLDFIHETAAEIYAVAVTEGAVTREEMGKAEELFTPLS